MQVVGAFNVLLRPGLRKNFRDELQAHEPQYSQFLKTDKMDMPELGASIIAGPNRFYERGDNESIIYEDATIGPKVAGVDKEFALGMIVGRKLIEDDQYGVANQAAKWLARAANKTKEYRAAAFLDDAFTGNTFKAYDGLSWCNTAHTLIKSSSTFANTPSVQVGFSLTGVQSLIDLAQVAVDQTGDPIIVNLDKLIIGNNVGDVNRAIQIFQSNLEPFTAENQDNALRKRFGSMNVLVSVYKASKKSYFMYDSKLSDAWFYTKREVDFDDTFDFDTDASKHKSTMRFLIWGVDPIGWYGCNPT